MIDSLMVQQQVKSVWQHMVGVICLNLTYRKQVKQLLPKLFKRYPNATAFIRGRYKTQERMLRPLCMSKVRAKSFSVRSNSYAEEIFKRYSFYD